MRIAMKMAVFGSLVVGLDGVVATAATAKRYTNSSTTTPAAFAPLRFNAEGIFQMSIFGAFSSLLMGLFSKKKEVEEGEGKMDVCD